MSKILRRPQNKLVFTLPSFDIGCFSYVSGVIQTTFSPNLLLINSHLRAAGQGGGGCYPYVSPLSSWPQSTANINIFRWQSLDSYVHHFHLGKKTKTALESKSAIEIEAEETEAVCARDKRQPVRKEGRIYQNRSIDLIFLYHIVAHICHQKAKSGTNFFVKSAKNQCCKNF